ncbi:hypothetical protein KR222_006642, partial [Zaprionus bogoriensis]
ELEEGEVNSDEDSGSSSAAASLPVCRFYQRNACTWGASCRFKHPESRGLGNYVMFERLQLPKAPALPEAYYEQPPVQGCPHSSEPEGSFDHNLHSLKEIMQNAGYRLGASAQNSHRPWIEYNDLDTDPYYTQQQAELPLPPRSCTPLETERQVTVHFSSDSSTPDYSSTTDSLSSSSSSFHGEQRKRRRRPYTPNQSPRQGHYSKRKRHLLSSSSSCISESSSTDSSELSSASMEYGSRSKKRRQSSSKARQSRSRISR